MRVARLVDDDARELHLNRHGATTFSFGAQTETRKPLKVAKSLFPAWETECTISDHRGPTARRQRNRRPPASPRLTPLATGCSPPPAATRALPAWRVSAPRPPQARGTRTTRSAAWPRA